MSRQYSQICHTCRVDRPLSAFGWHVVTWYVTADRKVEVPGGAHFGGPNRTCNACWNACKAMHAWRLECDREEYEARNPQVCP